MRHNMNKGKDELNDLRWTGRIAEWTRHNTNKGKDELNDLNDRQLFNNGMLAVETVKDQFCGQPHPGNEVLFSSVQIHNLLNLLGFHGSNRAPSK